MKGNFRKQSGNLNFNVSLLKVLTMRSFMHWLTALEKMK